MWCATAGACHAEHDSASVAVAIRARSECANIVLLRVPRAAALYASANAPTVPPPPSAPNDPRVSCAQQTRDPWTCPAQPMHDTLRQVSLRDHGLSSLPRLAPLFLFSPRSPLPPCVVYYGLILSPSRKKHHVRTIFSVVFVGLPHLPSPHLPSLTQTNIFVLGPAVINTHTQSRSNEHTHSLANSLILPLLLSHNIPLPRVTSA
jgi:hypothetical protein